MEVSECTDALEPTELAPFVVGRHAVFTTSLDVERGQIQAPLLSRLLEQVIGHFLCHRVVKSLCNLKKRDEINVLQE